MNKAALAGQRVVIGVEEPVAAGGITVGGLQDGQAEAAVFAEDTGDAGGVVGTVRFELPGVQCLTEAPAGQQAVPDGVGLVAIGDDQVVAHLADGMIDDEAGIGHLGGIVGLGADAVLGDGEHPVPGVLAAAHDEIGGHGVLVVGTAAPSIGERLGNIKCL